MHFWGCRVKGICSHEIFRGIAKFSNFSLQAFPSYRPLSQLQAFEESAGIFATAVNDRVKKRDFLHHALEDQIQIFILNADFIPLMRT
jgi:hypothetical protein